MMEALLPLKAAVVEANVAEAEAEGQAEEAEEASEVASLSPITRITNGWVTQQGLVHGPRMPNLIKACLTMQIC